MLFLFLLVETLMRFYYASYSLHSFHWDESVERKVWFPSVVYCMLSLCRQDEDQNCANFAKYPCSCSARLLTTKTLLWAPKKKKKERQRCRMWGGGQIPIAYLFTDEMMAIWNRSPISWLVYQTKLRFWLKKNKYISNHKKAEHSKNKVTFNLKVNKYVLQNVRWRSSKCAFWDWKFDTTF